MMKLVRAHVLISGKVQGVFFRQKLKDEAQELGLTGWAKNLPSGEVGAVFEGPENNVKEIILHCHDGPRFSRVDNVDVKYEDLTGEFKGFKIL